MKQSPRQIYDAALQERASSDPLKKRQACEKGWLAVIAAVDAFLANHGTHIPTGTTEAHGLRNKFLVKLVGIVPGAEKLSTLVSKAADQLHGTCFYLGHDTPHYTKVLKRDVKEVLQITGFWADGEE